MNSNNAIEVKNMSKDFKRIFDKPQTLKENLVFWHKQKTEYHHVLKNINLEIKKGETVALVGTNGSGKSTLLKLMTKILYPTSGTLETQGKLTSLLELGAGFHPDFTGRENIYFNASIFGLTKKDIDKRVDDIIAFSELGDFIDNPVRTYSSGMYMRLAFSVAINVDAEILLIDEILAVGDQHFQDKCFAKLEELRDSDKTIVIVSHSLDMIEKLCTRAVWIYKGDIKMDGKPKNIIKDYLEQIIRDHEKITENNVFIKKECILEIESPKKGNKLSADVIEIKGWEVSNVRENKIEIYLDNKYIGDANRYKRPDVLMHYQEAVGGASMNVNAGFTYNLDCKDFEGLFILKIIVRDNEEILASEIIELNVEK